MVIGSHVPMFMGFSKLWSSGGSLDIGEGDALKGIFLTALYLWFKYSFLGPLAAAGIIKGIVAIMAACGLSAATSPMYDKS